MTHQATCLLINQYGSLKYLSPTAIEELETIIIPIIERINTITKIK